MAKIGIFGELLFLVRHVDQKIESFTLVIAFDNSRELLLVQFQNSVHRRTKLIEQTVVFFTPGPAGLRCNSIWRIVHRAAPHLRRFLCNRLARADLIGKRAKCASFHFRIC